MIKLSEIRDLIKPINEVLIDVLSRKARLDLEYEKWIYDFVDERAFNFGESVPINSSLSYKENLVSVIQRDVITYKESVVIFLQNPIYAETINAEQCRKDIQKKCMEFKERLVNLDTL